MYCPAMLLDTKPVQKLIENISWQVCVNMPCGYNSPKGKNYGY